MDWTLNSEGEDWKNILFEFRDRSWEITIDLNEANVDYFVKRRCDELELVDLDEADLIVDWTKKNDYRD